MNERRGSIRRQEVNQKTLATEHSLGRLSAALSVVTTGEAVIDQGYVVRSKEYILPGSILSTSISIREGHVNIYRRGIFHYRHTQEIDTSKGRHSLVSRFNHNQEANKPVKIVVEAFKENPQPNRRGRNTKKKLTQKDISQDEELKAAYEQLTRHLIQVEEEPEREGFPTFLMTDEAALRYIEQLFALK